jgi:peptidoglycan lytic transglycosylase
MRMRKTIGLSLALLFASAAAMASEAEAAGHSPVHVKAKPSRAATSTAKTAGKRHHARHAAAARVEHHHARHAAAARAERSHDRRAGRHVAVLPPPDEYIGPVRVTGRREIGAAAWYGGRHVGRRTASGERLDRVHVTAAHRWLPLHSLVRVTNLSNGRSVIAMINDRGPVSHSLLIDVSPRAAKELDMMTAGIAKVAVEPVVTMSEASR